MLGPVTFEHADWVSDHRGGRIPQSSAPHVVERMVGLLGPAPGHRVLEIGTGSGWSGAWLAQAVGPGGRVVTLDVVAPLVERAAARYREAGIGTVEAHAADGSAGRPAGAPYDRVVAWTTPAAVPRAWLDQATHGAVLVTPVPLAPVANANAVLRCRMIGGEPAGGTLHSGNFVEMAPEVRSDGVPTRFVDVVLDGGAGTWLSGVRLRGRPASEPADLARRLAVAGTLPVTPARASAFAAFVLATSPNPASAGSARRWGVGVATPDGIAVLAGGAVLAAGSPAARDELVARHACWVASGGPGLEDLVVTFRAGAGAWQVRASV